MISQDNHVAPMQLPDPRAGGIVSPATTTPTTISRSTVFTVSSDLNTATVAPDSQQHTDANSQQTNSANQEDRPSTHSTQTIKGGPSRTSSQQPYTGGSVVCFLNDVVPANLDMKNFRKFRMRRRLFLLTVMTIGFFTTMVYSLLFNCCTVITVDGSALPPRWEPGLGAMISDAPDSHSASDISLPASDRSSSTLQSNGRPMAQTLGIGSSEMLIVSGRASVLDREYYGKKIGSRTILLASSSSDTFPMPESSMSLFPESPRSITLDVSSQRSRAPTYQQKESAQHNRGSAQHRQHHALQMQEEKSKPLPMTQQDQENYHQQNVKWEKEQKSQQIMESLKSRPGQGSTIIHFWRRNIKGTKLPQIDASSDRQRDKGNRNTKDSDKNVDYAVANGEDYLEGEGEEEVPIQLFSPGTNTQINIQIEKNDRNDKNNLIDFKKILSKSKPKEKSATSFEKIYSKSNIDFAIMQQVLSQRERTSPVSSDRRKGIINQWKQLTLPAETGNLKPDISPSSSEEFNMYYVTGTRDIGTINDIGTSRRSDNQINIDAVDPNVPISDGSFGREVDDENNVIYGDDQKDYYYFPVDSQTVDRSEGPALKASTKGQSVPTGDSSILAEQIIFVDSKVKNNDSYFEYRDDEDGDEGDYYEEDDGVEGVEHDSDVNNNDSKHRHNTERTRTSLPHSLSLPVKGVERDSGISSKDGNVSKPKRHITERARTPLQHLLSLPPLVSRARSFSSQPDQLSAVLRKGEQGSLSPVGAMGPTSSSSLARHRVVKSRAKQPSILLQHIHKSRQVIQTSLLNRSAASLSSSSSSSLSISSVLASAPVNADKLHVGLPPFAVPHQPRAGPSGVRVQQFPTKKLPQAIIIGVKKGGTRAVLEFLRLHPNVRAPGPEPHFFDRHYQKGFDWYRNKMPATFDDQITIEKTPSYFVTKEVPRRIFNMSKDIKLIVVVRDPVTRAISDYTQTVSKRTQLRSFEQMVFINNTRIVDTSWGAIRIGVYAKHVSLWLKFFNLSQIHFVNGERLITDPAGEMAQLQDFLGLKRIINERHFYFNETKGFPCLKKPEGSGHPHCLGKTKGRIHPIIPQKVLKRLRDFYRPFNSKFYQLVQKDFQWS